MGGTGGSCQQANHWIAFGLSDRGCPVELTTSYRQALAADVLERYEFAEVRNAAATLKATNPPAFGDVEEVLRGFVLTVANLTDAGGQKGAIARSLDGAFRERGWREAASWSRTQLTLQIQPYRGANERQVVTQEFTFTTNSHKVDNVRGRVALEVEWNAKDGNLDRDLANFRALHEFGVVDAAVIITRHHERTYYAANYIAEAAGRVRFGPRGARIILLGTTTTTNLEKLSPRLQRGDAGGCPVLAVAITEKAYQPGPQDPPLPPYRGPIAVAGEPAPVEEGEDE
jgi:hypothetical protein